MYSSGKGIILLVEDDEIAAHIEFQFLIDCGYSVLLATTGENAIQIIKSNSSINLILMDIELGENLNGMDVAELILKERDIPIIFLSNYTDPEIMNRIREISCYGYILKTTFMTVLDASIGMALNLFEEKNNTKKIQSKLIESEKHYRLLFEQANDIIFILDLNGNFQEANPLASQLLGYSRDELLTMSIRDIILPEYKEIQKKQFGEILSGQRVVGEREIICKDKSTLHMEFSASLRTDDLIQATLRDITKKIKIEQSLKNATHQLKKAHIDILQRQFAIDQHGIVAITDTAGTILYANDRFCEISKYSREELIGSNHRIINSGYHPKEFFHEMYLTIKNGIVWQGEIRNRTKDGSIYWVSTTIAPLKNEDGKIEQYLALRTIITERIEAEEKLRAHQRELEIQNTELNKAYEELAITQARYFDLYDLAPVGYFTTDSTGSILEANLTLAIMLGINRSELFEKFIFEFITEEDQEVFYLKRDDLIQTGMLETFELRMKKANGSNFWAKIDSIIRHDEKGTPKYRLVLTDVSKRKAVEKELNQYMQDLEELNRTKDKFFSIIAHDLRNPFGGIIGISNLLEEKLKEENTINLPQCIRYAEMIQTSSKSAFNLLENLLLWARSQTGEIDIRPTNLAINHLISYTIPIVIGNAFNKNITIETNLSDIDRVYADESFVNTVLRNLLTNAIKFTRPNGKIIISTINKEKFLEISIADTGVGIDPSKITNMFRIGSKISMLGTNNEKGSGLGLILCKDFVEKLGGKIWVESDLGKGSKFTFALPLEHK